MKTILLALVFVVIVGFGTQASAQDPKVTARWPVCQVGKAPIAPGPAPKEAQVFKAEGGPVLMTEDGTKKWDPIRAIKCRLPKDTPSYRGTDGTLRDVASNQPYWPVGWDAVPPPSGLPGKPGENGYTPIKGVDYFDGKNGADGRTPIKGVDYFDGKPGTNGSNAVAPPSSSGFWSSKKGKLIIAGIGVGGGYLAWDNYRHQSSTTATVKVTVIIR